MIINKKGYEFLFSNFERMFSVWHIIQHSDNNIILQETFLTEMIKNKDKFENNILYSEGVAKLKDRILKNNFGYQYYGSQFDFNQKIKQVEIVPIIKNFNDETFLNLDIEEDIVILNKRREENFSKFTNIKDLIKEKTS